jgi:hypothetical protein
MNLCFSLLSMIISYELLYCTDNSLIIYLGDLSESSEIYSIERVQIIALTQVESITDGSFSRCYHIGSLVHDTHRVYKYIVLEF